MKEMENDFITRNTNSVKTKTEAFMDHCGDYCMYLISRVPFVLFDHEYETNITFKVLEMFHLLAS